MKKLTAFRVLFGVLIFSAVVLFLCQLRSSSWLQTEITALLPAEQSWSEVQKQADHIRQQRLNRQVIALITHTEAEKAFHLAKQVSKMWQQSGLFSHIVDNVTPDVEQLKQEVAQLRLAMLPNDVRQQLLDNPSSYFAQYAQHIVNPFEQSILPIDQDKLGFGRFVLEKSQQLSRVQWHSETGMLFIPTDKVWVLIRGELAESDFISPQHTLLNLIEHNEQYVLQQNGEWLATGTSLFSAQAKQQAEKESMLMSGIGITLTLLLLFLVFRSWRVLWLFVPIIVGMLSGVVASVLVFGHIHILTLVVGTSLVGVLVDFPLHWFAASLFGKHWQADVSMQRLHFPFLLSLLITLLGYGLLGFTTLPILQQTALFSGVALIFATLTTMLYLPLFFVHYQPYKRSFSVIKMPFSLSPNKEKMLWLCAILFLSGGVWRSQWKDDIRDWVAISPTMLKQAQQIGEISGVDLSSQYFLIVAENDESLLIKEKSLIERLDDLQHQGKLEQFHALGQWIMPLVEQRQFIGQFMQNVQVKDYLLLQEMGILEDRADLQKVLKETPLTTLQQALNTQLGQSWQSLYLGQISANQVASIVTLSGVKEMAAVEALSQNGIYWQDKRQHLNMAFQHTRNQAGWLKLFSFFIAGGMLYGFFGLKKSSQMLMIPLGAIMASIGILGWLGIPISLFAMFGLLLASAIGIDYTAYMQTVREPIVAKRVAVLLAAATTLISFLLLAMSSTPAVMAFGLSVSLGVLFSVLMTLRIFRI